MILYSCVRIVFSFIFFVTFFLLTYWHGVDDLLARWWTDKNYSHGLLIPLISIYFIWLKKATFSNHYAPSWFALLFASLSLILLLLGEFTVLYGLIHYAMLLMLMAYVMALGGSALMRQLLWPILLLFFAIPLPAFIEAALSASLQRWSSEIGVMLLQGLHIPVFGDGNIIDLGDYKLQVSEACSGLRYLFPLMSLGFIAAYLFRGQFWKKMIVFMSIIPITIFMNSFRIAMTGVLLHFFGVGMAENFIHAFEGWVIFLVCLALLSILMWILSKLGDPPLDIKVINAQEKVKIKSPYVLNKPLMVICIFQLMAVLIIKNMSDVDTLTVNRKSFAKFPLVINEWHGQRRFLTAKINVKLQVSDYLLMDYYRFSKLINLYIGYYNTQSNSMTPHSPKVCIPGGGWDIIDIRRQILRSDALSRFSYNRVIIQKNDKRLLVYYWFQQGPTKQASEYWAKWHLLQNKLLNNRSDAALVRFVTPINDDEEFAIAESRLQQFILIVLPLLPLYLPE